MAKTDRNSNYMKEVFGTTSLITDYVVPEQNDAIESIIAEVRSSYDALSDELLYYCSEECSEAVRCTNRLYNLKIAIDKLIQLREQK